MKFVFHQAEYDGKALVQDYWLYMGPTSFTQTSPVCTRPITAFTAQAIQF